LPVPAQNFDIFFPHGAEERLKNLKGKKVDAWCVVPIEGKNPEIPQCAFSEAEQGESARESATSLEIRVNEGELWYKIRN